MEQKTTVKQTDIPLWVKWAVAISGVLVSLGTLYYFFFPRNMPEITNSNSPRTEINTAENTGVNNGIVAGKIEISETRKRIIDQNLIDFIARTYIDKKTELKIIYTDQGQETIDFANTLQQYIQSQGWKVDPPHFGLQACESFVNGLCFLPGGIVVSAVN